ncbi:hypothetical protein ROV95_09315 [Stenotrophomonas maltophilia group sp. msm1]|uniref:hypothetical protein n=1 Tax=Stenotrophomonas maltophilia group sp. msm1 TaxID=3061099 RepID=UPI002895FA7A|nr:hypothetical protein [Stenotrophomonas maltophilia group sp. msm1]MDT3556322.1 hypothetical protein [Stenotrophomonas maltophilia group sp. msm1]
MTEKFATLPTNCPVLRDAFETISAIAVEAVWLPNQAKAITLGQAQTALRDLHHRLPRLQDLRVFETAVTAYRATLRSSMQDGDTPLCDTTRARLAQADELLELVRNQSRTVIDPADPWRGLYHPSRLPARNADGEILCHPDVPMWPDGREVSLRPLFLAQGFDLAVVEGEFSEEGIGSGVYAAQELHDWNPEAPGEDWRLAWLGETEHGLAAWFVRPLAIAAMNRPTAASTLADVQPGGMVRLGDAPWPEIDAILADAYSAGAVGLPFEGVARRHAVRAAVAALAAQPSPGGQGDAPPCWWIDHGTYGQITQRQDEADAAVNAGKRVVSYVARQPVGEPITVEAVATVRRWATGDRYIDWLTEGGIADLEVGDVLMVSDRAITDEDGSGEVYAAPPAQAVDTWPVIERVAKNWDGCSIGAAIRAEAEKVIGQPAQAVDLGTGVKAIAAERERQLQAEGFTRDGDQQYRRGELAKAATAYVQLAAMDLEAGTRRHIAWHSPAAVWPWAPEWWKPVDARRDLVRAGALIAAQIDLIDSQTVGK